MWMRPAVAWPLLAMLGETAAFAAVRWFFVGTGTGQGLDRLALIGNRLGRGLLDGPLTGLLEAITVLSLGLATAAVAGIALLRGRTDLGVGAVVLIAGANATAELLKHAGHRAALDAAAGPTPPVNTLPSGHTSVSASVAVALVLVLPPRARGPAALLGAGFAALTGAATVAVGWHRPSDAVASFLVVAGWASAVGLVLACLRSGEPGRPADPGEQRATRILTAWGVVLLAAGAVALALTARALATPPGAHGRRTLLVAYAGSAAGICGTAGLSIALVLATLPRFPPWRSAPP
ncbi:phosphatase PAP2 family protein [Dactylosporangium sp. CA-233914]|uniref:phosphatase PAP2 family protein n=1 Tax=Dactylosporangium sp. CA-233914 TaxID=3239934 RepID=UPI003D90C063